MFKVLYYQELKNVHCWLKPEFSQKVKEMSLCNEFINTEPQVLEIGKGFAFNL